MTQEEEWRPVTVPGFEELYEVSALGRVRSHDRRVATRGNGTRVVPGRVLKGTVRGGYHLSVCLARPGIKMNHSIHRLVAVAFIGPCPPGMETLHGPGGRFDNRAVNLSYGTHSQNVGADKYRDGTMALGEAHHNAKLSEPVVREIRARYASGAHQRDLASEYGVSQSHVQRLTSGESWGHLGGDVFSRIEAPTGRDQ